eukprot:3840222-Pleurochrysis_carterae.AAC.1
MERWSRPPPPRTGARSPQAHCIVPIPWTAFCRLEGGDGEGAPQGGPVGLGVLRKEVDVAAEGIGRCAVNGGACSVTPSEKGSH